MKHDDDEDEKEEDEEAKSQHRHLNFRILGFSPFISLRYYNMVHLVLIHIIRLMMLHTIKLMRRDERITFFKQSVPCRIFESCQTQAEEKRRPSTNQITTTRRMEDVLLNDNTNKE